MSKAIYGYLGGPEAALLAEVTRLRSRVRELEAQVAAHDAEIVVPPGSPEFAPLRAADIDVALRELGTSEHALT